MASLHIIPCDEWGAAHPTQPITPAGRPDKIIFHHTAGHHPELDHKPTESREEAMAYARSIQHDHMHRSPPFIDSGHNFLVTRSGHVLEGRHGSRDAINAGKMVVSAHCVGQNSQPGIEHEHIGNERMTPKQRRASVLLITHICRETGIDPHEIHPHNEFNPTDCPGVLRDELAEIRTEAAHELALHPAHA